MLYSEWMTSSRAPVSRLFVQRFLIVAAAILAGLLILEAIRFFFPIQLSSWVYLFALMPFALLAALLIAQLDLQKTEADKQNSEFYTPGCSKN